MDIYPEKGILAQGPFQTLDTAGVGQLIAQCVEKGRQNKERLKIGICGEHGGDAASVDFCFAHGFDYVSCSPYRLPLARLAAARAQLNRA